MALLYMLRVTILPIIRSTMLYMATGELASLSANFVIPNGRIRLIQLFLCVLVLVSRFACWASMNLIFVVPCIMLYSGEISPTRCSSCVFYSQWLYSTCFGWQSHPSSGVQCCIWPQVSCIVPAIYIAKWSILYCYK